MFMRPLYEAVILCDCIIDWYALTNHGASINMSIRSWVYYCKSRQDDITFSFIAKAGTDRQPFSITQYRPIIQPTDFVLPN